MTIFLLNNFFFTSMIFPVCLCIIKTFVVHHHHPRHPRVEVTLDSFWRLYVGKSCKIAEIFKITEKSLFNSIQHFISIITRFIVNVNSFMSTFLSRTSSEYQNRLSWAFDVVLSCAIWAYEGVWCSTTSEKALGKFWCAIMSLIDNGIEPFAEN